jgi:hypothetical protein
VAGLGGGAREGHELAGHNPVEVAVLHLLVVLVLLHVKLLALVPGDEADLDKGRVQPGKLSAARRFESCANGCRSAAARPCHPDAHTPLNTQTHLLGAVHARDDLLHRQLVGGHAAGCVAEAGEGLQRAQRCVRLLGAHAQVQHAVDAHQSGGVGALVRVAAHQQVHAPPSGLRGEQGGAAGRAPVGEPMGVSP